MTAVTTRGPVAVYPSKSNASRSSVSTGEMHAATPDISEGVVKPEPPVSAGGSENDSDDTNGWSNYKVRALSTHLRDVFPSSARKGKRKATVRRFSMRVS